MSKFNKKVSARTSNLAGGLAYRMGAEQELIHAVLTTFLDDKYYESGSDRIERIKKLIAENKPEFVANLAVIARQEFHLRSVSHILLGELSKMHRGDDLVKRTIVKSTNRPDDLMEIASYVGLPFPKQLKRGIRNAILKFDRYQLAKYKGEGKGISLVDLFNLTHPKTKHATDEQKLAWKDLVEGNLKSFDTWETELSNAKNNEERKILLENLIKENKIGYMALLRNLNNLVKYDVSKSVKEIAVSKLTNPEEIKKSKQLPFRFLTAYKNVSGERMFADAISIAMDHAVSNTPELSGKILIAIDSSRSMVGGAINKASIFAATLFKANQNADLILYDTNVKKPTSLSGRTPVIDLANSIEKMAMGGGTQTSLVFAYAAQEKKSYDRFIILSDNESWNEHSVQSSYVKYKELTQTDPFIYAIDTQGYGTKDITGSKVFHLTGWSERLLDFIAQAEKGNSLVDYVKNYEL